MKWIWLSYALSIQHTDPVSASSLLQTWSTTGRIVDMPTLHLGVRGAAFADPEGDNGSIEWGLGFTVQISVLMQP